MQTYLTMEVEIRPERNETQLQATVRTLREIADGMIEFDTVHIDDADNRLAMTWHGGPTHVLKFKRDNIAKEKRLRELFNEYRSLEDAKQVLGR